MSAEVHQFSEKELSHPLTDPEISMQELYSPFFIQSLINFSTGWWNASVYMLALSPIIQFSSWLDLVNLSAGGMR